MPAYRAKMARFCTADCMNASAPTITNPDDSVSIPLHARDGSVRGYVTVDAEDAEWAVQWRWCTSSYNYATRVERVAGRSSSTIYMHRELLGLTPGDGLEGDHIDRDRRNNRRSNLRIVPKGAQTHNRSKTHGRTSQYRGVSWDRATGRWTAGVKVNGKTVNLGAFQNETDAAEAARSARLRLLTYAVD